MQKPAALIWGNWLLTAGVCLECMEYAVLKAGLYADFPTASAVVKVAGICLTLFGMYAVNRRFKAYRSVLFFLLVIGKSFYPVVVVILCKTNPAIGALRGMIWLSEMTAVILVYQKSTTQWLDTSADEHS